MSVPLTFYNDDGLCFLDIGYYDDNCEVKLTWI